jgi:rhamnose utilization protein RhaD (predicted bifunctional aldolase and dehydrogenase)
MIALVDMAERYLEKNKAWSLAQPATNAMTAPVGELAALRNEISRAAGFPLVMASHRDARTAAFITRKDISGISQQGPATPDHVIRTKRLPLLGRDVAAFVANYKTYFSQHNAGTKEPKTMLDPAPRLVLDGQLGMCTLGRSMKDANIIADIYRHTMDIIERAELLGGWRALPAKDIFDVEYWDLEQAKLIFSASDAMFLQQQTFRPQSTPPRTLSAASTCSCLMPACFPAARRLPNWMTINGARSCR